MSVNLFLYGHLYKYSENLGKKGESPAKVEVDLEQITSVADLIEKFGINEEEISHIFLNGKYCGPGVELNNGDRVGIFPNNMALMFAEIEKNNSVWLEVSISERLLKNTPLKFRIRVPQGSKIKYLIRKLNISEDIENMVVKLNEEQVSESSILQKGDRITIL